MAKDREEIEALKSSLSITQVAEHLGYKVVHGKIRCPYFMRHAHGDRTPSVSLSESKGLFNCWVCPDVHGDVIHLVEISKNCSFLEAIEWLQNEFSLSFRIEHSKIPRERPMPPAFTDVRKAKPAPEVDPVLKARVVLSFFEMLSVIEDTPAAKWLIKRRIFKKTWQMMRLRTIVDYDKVNRGLLEKFGKEALQLVGLFNENGNLKYYKHPLLFPYLDAKVVPRYFQARAIDSSIVPKELNLKGIVPFPYNVSVLDGNPGWVYLCEGVVDTLTLLDRGFCAVGIPGVKSFKPEWASLFRNKRVILCLDQDKAGRSGTELVQGYLKNLGIEAVPLGSGITAERFKMAEGQDINEWFGGKK